MTSIHASIPANLRDAAKDAKCRGELSENVYEDSVARRPRMSNKSASAPSAITRRLPERLTVTRPVGQLQTALTDEDTSDAEDDEATASKENNPALSPQGVFHQSPRRPTLAKRPLSDLPCPTEAELRTAVSRSQQNVMNNAIHVQPRSSSPGESHHGSQLAERNYMINFTGRGMRDAEGDRSDGAAFSEEGSHPRKRVCSDETKENAAEPCRTDILTKPSRLSSTSRVPSSARTASAASSASSGGSSRPGKTRIGLRRL